MPGGKKSIRRCANINVASLALTYGKVWVFGILGSADAALDQMPIQLGPMPKDCGCAVNINVEQGTARFNLHITR